MRGLSEKEYNIRMRQIQRQNVVIERMQALKKEERKYNPFFCFIHRVNTSNKLLIVAVTAIVAYTVAAFFMQYTVGVEISSTLTTLWYSFWTVEIVALASIKVTKVRHNYNAPNPEESIPDEEEG